MRSKLRLLALLVFTVMIPSAFAQSLYLLPQVANGVFPDGSFRTSFVVVNNTNSTATATLALTRDEGEPLEVTIPGLGTRSTFTLTLSPGATRILQTDGGGNLDSGAGTLTSDVPLGVSAVFTLQDPGGTVLTEAGAGDSPALSQFTFPVQVSRTLDTGIALYNPSTSAVLLSLRLLDGDGAVVGTTELALPPKNHTARFASELFPIAGFIGGSIAVTGTGEIAALVLRQNTSAGTPTYTNLPVTAGVSQGTADGTKIGTTPTQINRLSEVVAVTSGAVLKNDGTVWALSATYGADWKTVISLTPTRIDGLTDVVAVSGGMALKRDGTVWDLSGPQPAQVSGLSDVAAIDGSWGSVLALKRDGTVWAWWTPGIPDPEEVAEARGAVAVAEMGFGGVALMSDGTVWHFSLVDEDIRSWQVRGLAGIVAIDANFDVGLALKVDGTVWDFGGSAFQVQGITGAVGISAGGGQYLVLAQDGTVWEWGNFLPPLANARKVDGLTGVVQVAAGNWHSLALRSDGTVWAWGYN